MAFCASCSDDPCHREVFGEMLRAQALVVDDELEANNKRKMLYGTYIRAVHGVLGRGVRKDIPQCIIDLVHKIFHDEHGQYMGHKEN